MCLVVSCVWCVPACAYRNQQAETLLVVGTATAAVGAGIASGGCLEGDPETDHFLCVDGEGSLGAGDPETGLGVAISGAAISLSGLIMLIVEGE